MANSRQKSAIRMALVGIGVRGRQWARVIHEEVAAEAVAYVDPRFEDPNTEDLFDPHGVPCYTDLAVALEATAPDAMVLATPPGIHHQQIMQAFLRGIHVLAEKPLAENLSEALDLVGQAERCGLQLMVGMNFRYLPVHQTIRRLVREGQLGEPSFGQFTYLRHRDGRRADLNDHCLIQEQPMLLEQSIHHLDLMRYCYDREVAWVQADTWNPPWSVYQDDSNVSALLCFDGGMRVNYLGTWTAAWNQFNFQWRTDCSAGVLLQKAQFDDLYLVRFSPQLAGTGELFKRKAEPLQPVQLEPVEYFIDDTQGLLAEFVQALQSGRPVETSARDHLKTLALTRACIEASRTGQRVYMSAFYREQGIPQAWL